LPESSGISPYTPTAISATVETGDTLGICIELFFTVLSCEQRIEKIRDIGFRVYKFWFHNRIFDGKALINEMKNFEKIAELNERYNLTIADFVFNHPDGGIVASLIDKKDRNRLLDSIIDRMGYDGFFGLEYWPSLDYEEPLRRTLEYFS